MIKDCQLNNECLKDVLSIGIFGSYHEECFDKNRSDIDVMILLKKELDFDEEFEIEDYLLGYSAFKRDREPLEVIRNENLKELEAIKNGLFS